MSELSQTAEEISKVDGALSALYSREEFRVFEKLIEAEIKSGIEKMLRGRKEETMRELAREVKTYRSVLDLVRSAFYRKRKG